MRRVELLKPALGRGPAESASWRPGKHYFPWFPPGAGYGRGRLIMSREATAGKEMSPICPTTEAVRGCVASARLMKAYARP
jgi:hypothetical protein